MNNIVVGVGDCQVSNNPDKSLVTYALGSCIAIVIYDPIARVGGMLHYLLPDSTIDAEKAIRAPFTYADTGIPKLFHTAYGLGAEKRRLNVLAAGGAQVLSSELFQIGKRNHLAMKKIMWRAGVLVHHEEVGGDQSRTIRMELSTGRIFMKLAGAAEQLIGQNSSGMKGKAA
jgi:chemotaxis protein CheD